MWLKSLEVSVVTQSNALQTIHEALMVRNVCNVVKTDELAHWLMDAKIILVETFGTEYDARTEITQFTDTHFWKAVKSLEPY